MENYSNKPKRGGYYAKNNYYSNQQSNNAYNRNNKINAKVVKDEKSKPGQFLSPNFLEQIKNTADINEVISQLTDNLVKRIDNTEFKPTSFNTFAEVLLRISTVNSGPVKDILNAILDSTFLSDKNINTCIKELPEKIYKNIQFYLKSTNVNEKTKIINSIKNDFQYMLNISNIFQELLIKFKNKQRNIPIKSLIDILGNYYLDQSDIEKLQNKEINKLLEDCKEQKQVMVESQKTLMKEEVKEKLEIKDKKNNPNPSNNEVLIDYQEAETFISFDEISDINPIIQPHREKGTYDSWDRYLNTLFYLLREDCYRSLRLSINKIFNRSKNIDEKLYEREREFRDIYYYNEARIENMEINVKGITLTLGFKILRNSVSWSKRMMFGSLLLITDSKLSDFFLATIVESPLELKEKIKFKRNKKHEDINSMRKYSCNVQLLGNTMESFKSFISLYNSKENSILQIFESKAYFESYYHILKRIQDIDANLLYRFTDVIINYNAQTSRMIPNYISRLTKYIHEGTLFSIFGNQDQWPIDLHKTLDQSQMKALIHAVTNKVALVQGPPGTGKTFVGAKIMKMLLENTESQILVVCHTNHAVDQFLKHIMKFNKNIVRIGGRSKDEELQNYTLRNVKANLGKKSAAIKNYGIALWNKRQEILKLADSMKDFSGIINIKKTLNYQTCKEFCKDLIDKIMNDFRKLVDIAKNVKLDNIYESIFKAWSYSLSINDLKQKVADLLKFKEIDYWQFMDHPIWHKLETYNSKDFEKKKNVIEIDDLYLNIIKEEKKDEVFNEEPSIDEDELEEETRLENLDRRELEDEEDGEFEVINIDDKDQNNLISFSDENIIMKTIDEKKFKEILNAHTNIWHLGIDMRIQVGNFLKSYYVNHSLKNYSNEIEKLNKLIKEKNELEHLRDIEIIKECRIVGMTTTGCSKYSIYLEQLDFKIVIIEEAAEVLESHIASLLTQHTRHLILIGDHQQLKPHTYNHEISMKFKFNVSLFERLINNEIPKVTLSYQRRMRPEFADFIRLIYNKEYKDHISTCNKPNNLGFTSNIYFLNHKQYENSDSDTASKSNQFEANFVIKLASFIIAQNYKPEQITILTLYIGQVLLIRNILKAKNMDKLGIKVVTVDNYQGEENDFILLSLVRSNKENKIGFVKILNRICVSLSRAILGLYIFGNFDCFKKGQEEKNVLWTDIFNLASEKKVISDTMIFKCQRHKNEMVVKSPDDFDKYAEGGCLNDCKERLECGHVCEFKCHNFPHSKFDCKKNCERILPCNHKCKKKCRENCGNCLETTQIKLPCHHVNSDYCYKSANERQCNSNCEKILKCGHQCRKKCWIKCDENDCTELVPAKLLCGHYIELPCNKKVDDYTNECSIKCNTLLDCEHYCQGTCGSCLNGTLHIPCKKVCERKIICGHICKKKCGEACICEAKCENVCDHGFCGYNCYIPCVECSEKCKAKCKHRKCNKLCRDICDIPNCEERCDKTLQCNHRCIGLCGEPCPGVCRECFPENEIFNCMLYESEKDSLFIILDCGHIYEKEFLDKYLDVSDLSSSNYKATKCLTCQKSFQYKGNRYKNVLKMKLKNIQKIKKVMLKEFGDYTNLHNQIKMDIERFQNNIIKNSSECIEKFLKDFTYVSANQYNVLPSLFNIVQLLEDFYQIDRFEIDKCKSKSIIFYYKQNLHIIRKYFSNPEATYSQNFFKRLSNKIDALYISVMILKETELNSFDEPLLIDLLNKSIDANRLAQLKNNYMKERQKREVLEISSIIGGRWYQCPRGHVYSVGDCGQPMETAKCPDCNSSIGGQNHILVQNNSDFNINR